LSHYNWIYNIDKKDENNLRKLSLCCEVQAKEQFNAMRLANEKSIVYLISYSKLFCEIKD